ncbi:hypothetical protein [Flexithrix dorotheae]|uniref:hypothetical protein n=1 Tax=Flexithrix dorotheae TaxID=70993 RepID=UPI0003746838|nr:hypothetical protein [Flexithrix dorotheae]
MKPTNKYILLFNLFFVINFACAQVNEEDWQELSTQDGVEFVWMKTSSKISGNLNVVIRVKNTNPYKVFVAFEPAFICAGNQEENQPKEEIYLESNAEPSLHSFRVCTLENEPEVKLKNLVIKQEN